MHPRRKGLGQKLPIPEMLIFEPNLASLEAIAKVLKIDDIARLERYVRLYNASNDHGTRESVLRDELGVDLTKLVILYSEPAAEQDGNYTFLNGSYPILRVSKAVSAAAIYKLVKGHGYTPEQIQELRGDDLFHVTLAGKVYHKTFG